MKEKCNMGKGIAAALGIILLSFIIGICLYPQMPEAMASHWNIKGEADGYMPRFWGLFLMPFVSVGILLLFILIPRIDPLKRNYRKFRGHYEVFIAVIIAFLFYLYLLAILWNIGFGFNMIQLLSPAFGIVFYYAGILVGKAKRNWFVGIKTPWTLSNEKVWNKTHRIGGRLFRAAGVIALFGALFPDYGIFLVLVPVLFVAAYTIAYSYLEYRKLAG